jgi:hypothetical protein
MAFAEDSPNRHSATTPYSAARVDLQGDLPGLDLEMRYLDTLGP